METNLFVNFLALCQFVLLNNFTNGYVLFAANLEDFRSIAKKFVPEKLADQLVEMASRTSDKHEQQKNRDYYDIEESEESGRDRLRDTKSYGSKPTTVKKKIDDYQSPNIDIDELVEKIKKRLEGDYKNIVFQSKNPRNKQKTIHTPNNDPKREKNNNFNKNIEDYELDDKETTPYVDYIDNAQRIPKYQKNPKPETDYVDKVLETQDENHGKDTGYIFDQIDMRKSNDSYEDYDIPKKEEAFESVEHPSKDEEDKENKEIEYHQVSNNKAPGNVVPYVNEWSKLKRTTEENHYDYNDEMKARTESLLYEEVVKASVSIDGAVRNKMKPKGTMIPTREHYKMSSPNYYAKLPVVAERYNFNEPLPEKDRERENLKHIGNPPSSINRKVKLR